MAAWELDLDERMPLMEEHVMVWEIDLDEAMLLMEYTVRLQSGFLWLKVGSKNVIQNACL